MMGIIYIICLKYITWKVKVKIWHHCMWFYNSNNSRTEKLGKKPQSHNRVLADNKAASQKQYENWVTPQFDKVQPASGSTV